MDRIQVISIVVSVFILFGVFNLVRRRRLKTEYSLIWLTVSIFFVVLSFWKRGIDVLADFFGIDYAPSVLFLLLIVGVFLILIEFSLIISKQAEKIKLLTQELGLLKNELKREIKSAQENKNDVKHEESSSQK